jgi:hypothetical protein
MKIELRYGNKFFAQFVGKFLIGGDFTGHHHPCGNSKNGTTRNNLFNCINEMETNIMLLNNGSQTYISDATGSKVAFDLIFVAPRSALLYIWKFGTDPWNSDHFPISVEYDGIIEPRTGSKKASRLHNKYTDWTAFMEKVREKITEVEMHNGWNRERGMKRKDTRILSTFKTKNKNTLGNGGQGKIGSKEKRPEFVWWKRMR